MIAKILVILLIIIVILFFLLFLKTWHLHILFKNHNLNHEFKITITILFMEIIISNLTSATEIKFKLNIFSRKKSIKTIYPQKNKFNEYIPDNNDDFDIEVIRQIYTLIMKSKEDLYKIMLLVIKVVTFENSTAYINLGLHENNKTIKLCNLLWSLTAPLYPLNFQLILTPEINRLILKSDIDLVFNIKTFNIIKIVIVIIRNENLRNIVKIIR